MRDEIQLSTLCLITAIGKALIAKGVIDGSDISIELEEIKVGTQPIPESFELEINNLIKAVSNW